MLLKLSVKKKIKSGNITRDPFVELRLVASASTLKMILMVISYCFAATLLQN
jgi:hypothetical protein